MVALLAIVGGSDFLVAGDPAAFPFAGVFSLFAAFGRVVRNAPRVRISSS